MKSYKTIVAGCGNMSTRWIEMAKKQPDITLVGFMDIHEEAARRKAQDHQPQAASGTDLASLIENTGADLVIDTTVPEAHHSIIMTALAAGCHVLAEKPMAVTLEQGREMCAKARETGLHYSVMQNRRYLKPIRALRDLIKTGCIGDPGLYTADFYLDPHFGGFRDAMDSPLILDMAVHTFDQARLITGTDAVTVYCQEFNPGWSWYHGDAAALVIFEMSDGSYFQYRGMWCGLGIHTSWESEWRIMASRGAAYWDGQNWPIYRTQTPEKGAEPSEPITHDIDYPGEEGHDGCFAAMLNALREDRTAETDGTDNIKSLAMVHGAFESSRRGEKIVIEV